MVLAVSVTVAAGVAAGCTAAETRHADGTTAPARPPGATAMAEAPLGAGEEMLRGVLRSAALGAGAVMENSTLV